jgi:hypothetical protein
LETLLQHETYGAARALPSADYGGRVAPDSDDDVREVVCVDDDDDAAEAAMVTFVLDEQRGVWDIEYGSGGGHAHAGGSFPVADAALAARVKQEEPAAPAAPVALAAPVQPRALVGDAAAAAADEHRDDVVVISDDEVVEEPAAAVMAPAAAVQPRTLAAAGAAATAAPEHDAVMSDEAGNGEEEENEPPLGFVPFGFAPAACCVRTGRAGAERPASRADWSALPHAALLHICELLPVDSRLCCREVCRTWSAAAGKPRTWLQPDAPAANGVARERERMAAEMPPAAAAPQQHVATRASLLRGAPPRTPAVPRASQQLCAQGGAQLTLARAAVAAGPATPPLAQQHAVAASHPALADAVQPARGAGAVHILDLAHHADVTDAGFCERLEAMLRQTASLPAEGAGITCERMELASLLLGAGGAGYAPPRCASRRRVLLCLADTDANVSAAGVRAPLAAVVCAALERLVATSLDDDVHAVLEIYTARSAIPFDEAAQLNRLLAACTLRCMTLVVMLNGVDAAAYAVVFGRVLQVHYSFLSTGSTALLTHPRTGETALVFMRGAAVPRLVQVAAGGGASSSAGAGEGSQLRVAEARPPCAPPRVQPGGHKWRMPKKALMAALVGGALLFTTVRDGADTLHAAETAMDALLRSSASALHGHSVV